MKVPAALSIATNNATPELTVEGRLIDDAAGARICEDSEGSGGIWISHELNELVGRIPPIVGGERSLDMDAVARGFLCVREDGRVEFFAFSSLVVIDDDGPLDVPLRPMADNERLEYDDETHSLHIVDAKSLFE